MHAEAVDVICHLLSSAGASMQNSCCSSIFLTDKSKRIWVFLLQALHQRRWWELIILLTQMQIYWNYPIRWWGFYNWPSHQRRWWEIFILLSEVQSMVSKKVANGLFQIYSIHDGIPNYKLINLIISLFQVQFIKSDDTLLLSTFPHMPSKSGPWRIGTITINTLKCEAF